MAELSVLADYRDLCGEGPLWDRQTNTLYWTDITGKRFYRLNWGTRERQIIQSDFEVAGFAFQEPGGFVVMNAQGIWQWDGTSAPRLKLAEADGAKCQMNDCVADPQGRSSRVRGFTICRATNIHWAT